jgi:hypothetical protein
VSSGGCTSLVRVERARGPEVRSAYALILAVILLCVYLALHVDEVLALYGV